MTDIYPQEITLVSLNLMSNGFYATTKRARGAGDYFRPTLLRHKPDALVHITSSIRLKISPLAEAHTSIAIPSRPVSSSGMAMSPPMDGLGP
jgi:hypothetical protein